MSPRTGPWVPREHLTIMPLQTACLDQRYRFSDGMLAVLVASNTEKRC
ncbi:hypothetical protein [Bacterioplanes sanyensis]|nr:hypothetical protein [Bacterioplanes sanyensis]